MKPAARGGEATAFRLVTRVFLRRLIDNDLLSPHSDRHESLAVLYALILSLAVFVTFFLCHNYLAAFILLPGVAALSALSDRFLFIAASICISALAALMVWDALGLEARDGAILGPLPIPGGTITRAKLAAAVMFGAVLTLALNALPSVIYPAFLTLNIRGTPGFTILRLIAVHATTVTMAGLFGFFAVLAIRSVLRLTLGERGFQKVSNTVQSALVVSMVTALLLAPTVRAGDVRRWVDGSSVPRWPARPVLWHLGVNETLAGHLVADTPVVLPPRIVTYRKREDEIARTIYRGLLPQFAALARPAWLSLPIVTALALAAFLWTNRRLPDRAAGVPSPSRVRASLHRIVERYTQDDPEAQAGFFFALQTLTRSAPHRTVIAIAVAIGLTHALIVLAQTGRYPMGIASTPLGVFAISTLLLLALLAGVAYAARIPAEPGASWIIRTAWLEDERHYLVGVKRAAMVFATAVVILLLPLHIAVLGTTVALAHALLGLLFATAAVHALFVSCRIVPFACTHVPLQNPKVAWPAGLAGLLIITYGFAMVERWALQRATRAIALGVIVATLAIVARAVDGVRRREPRPIDFDGRPAPATQRLGLFAHVTIHD